MRGLFKDANASVWGKLLGPFLASFAIGLAGIWLGVTCQNEFVKALGDAFAIAGIIGVCLELYVANRIIEHASNSVAAKMAGYGLPKAAQDVIYDLVHNTKRVYRDYRRTYRIVRHPEKPGYVIVHGTVSYRVVNNGTGSDNYLPKLAESEIYNPQFESLQYGDHVINGDEIDKEITKTSITFAPKASVTIAPSEANAPSDLLRKDQQCMVRWSCSIEMPEHYSDVTAYTGVTVHPMIELVEKPPDLDFFASEDNDCSHVGSTWTYERAFVAGQHIRAWWRPNARK